MTNNTINNVPRELLERLSGLIGQASRYSGDSEAYAAADLNALLSAPSPAGVDGLEVVGYSYGNGILINDTTQPDNPMYTKLVRLSDAQAIIDGLRGEVGAQRVKTCAALKERNDAREERDQRTNRIGKLAGLLRRSRRYVASATYSDSDSGDYVGRRRDGVLREIDAALSELPK